MSLKDKNAVVTGGRRRLGLGLVEALVAHGARVTLGLIKGVAAILLQRRRSTSMVHTNAKGSQRPRAIKHSTGAFAIATRTGVCKTSKRSPRWRDPLVSRLRLSPKCPQTI
jgi:NAD(P)-dependent dehydrogenase (short-subunit alcohol dehydrogenase family)